MYYKYWDTTKNELVDNPFNTYLTNEQKIKLKYDNQWYDFIIKDIQENSEKYIFTYTCTDLFIEELSKNGYAIELNEALGNNTGTTKELANRILDGSDWSIGNYKEIR